MITPNSFRYSNSFSDTSQTTIRIVTSTATERADPYTRLDNSANNIGWVTCEYCHTPINLSTAKIGKCFACGAPLTVNRK